jgi:pyruvate,water dikinase
MPATYTLSLDEISKEDVQRCGGKGANLGELTRAGVRVPPGFCITAGALAHVIDANSLAEPIARIAAGLDFEDLGMLEAETTRIRALIAAATIPADLEAEILDRYRALVGGEHEFVAVRSSVAVRDSPIGSFPGMMDTYHYVRGESDVLQRVRECWASLWTARGAFARHSRGIDHDRGLIAPVIQVMVDADTAGVLFTANPISGAATEIVIEANWGIGESVVSGKSLNDFYVLDKSDLAVKERRTARKNMMVTIDGERGSGRKEQQVPAELAVAPTLSDSQLAELGTAGLAIEAHFGFEVDVEWAYKGGTLFVLQARKIQHAAITNREGD